MSTAKRKPLILSSSTREIHLVKATDNQVVVSRSAADERELEYQAWLDRVNRICIACLGMHVDEMAGDPDTRPSFDEGVSAADFARDFISDFRYDHGLMSASELLGEDE